MIDAEELPSGWEEATVKELCGQPQYGYTESATHEAVGPKFLRITDIQDGDVNWDSVPFCPCNETPKYRLADGDILFARTGATTGKSYLVHNPPEAVFASYLIRIRPGKRVLPEYVWWYFQSSGYWASVFGGIDDGNRPNMNGSKLAALRVPFPKSKTEQRRLVARIEALTSRLEQARQARQAALAEADSLVDAAVALELERAAADSESVELGDLLTLVQYGTSEKATAEPKGVPVLRMGNIQDRRVRTENLKYLQLSAADLERYRLRVGDILINRPNSAELVGKTGIFDIAEGDYVFASYLIRLRVDSARADAAFINYVINSDGAQRFLKSNAKDAIGQTNISTKQIRLMPIALPSVASQRRIVARLDALAAKQTELRRLQTETEAELAAFTPALLAKAFRGEL